MGALFWLAEYVKPKGYSRNRRVRLAATELCGERQHLSDWVRANWTVRYFASAL
jgi:hypothetical protein